MANKRGWWRLTMTSADEDKPGPLELNDSDLEHIAKLVVEGYTEGEIVADD